MSINNLAIGYRTTGVRPRSWQGVLDTPLCDKVCQ
jgi:hypothetical protein